MCYSRHIQAHYVDSVAEHVPAASWAAAPREVVMLHLPLFAAATTTLRFDDLTASLLALYPPSRDSYTF